MNGWKNVRYRYTDAIKYYSPLRKKKPCHHDSVDGPGGRYAEWNTPKKDKYYVVLLINVESERKHMSYVNREEKALPGVWVEDEKVQGAGWWRVHSFCYKITEVWACHIECAQHRW